jgi:hypothetical protein
MIQNRSRRRGTIGVSASSLRLAVVSPALGTGVCRFRGCHESEQFHFCSIYVFQPSPTPASAHVKSRVLARAHMYTAVRRSIISTISIYSHHVPGKLTCCSDASAGRRRPSLSDSDVTRPADIMHAASASAPGHCVQVAPIDCSASTYKTCVHAY